MPACLSTSPTSFDIDPRPQSAPGVRPRHATSVSAPTSLASNYKLLLEELTCLESPTWPWFREPDIEPNIFARAVRSFVLSFRLALTFVSDVTLHTLTVADRVTL